MVLATSGTGWETTTSISRVLLRIEMRAHPEMEPARASGGGAISAAAFGSSLCLPSQGSSQSGSHSTWRGISPCSARTSWRAATLRSSSGRVIRSAMVFMASSERRSISSAWLLAITDEVCCLSSSVVLA